MFEFKVVLRVTLRVFEFIVVLGVILMCLSFEASLDSFNSVSKSDNKNKQANKKCRG